MVNLVHVLLVGATGIMPVYVLIIQVKVKTRKKMLDLLMVLMIVHMMISQITIKV